MEPVLLRPEEAARVIACSRSRLYELIKAGVVPTVCLGGTLRRVPAWALRELAGQSGAHSGGELPPAA